MKPGPRPKPTNAKRLQGNPGKRPLPKNEPKPQLEARKPHGLGKRPKVAKMWDEMAPELDRLGLLSGLDVPGLRIGLEHYAIVLEAIDGMRQGDGSLELTRLDENGVERKHPLLQIFRDNSEMYRKWSSEFGLTPASRTRLRMGPEAEQLSLADLLFQAIEEDADND